MIIMRQCVAALLLWASFAWAEVLVVDPTVHTAYGYINNVGIPRAEAIRKAEEQQAASRIVGGLPAVVGQYPFKVTYIRHYSLFLASMVLLNNKLRI